MVSKELYAREIKLWAILLLVLALIGEAAFFAIFGNSFFLFLMTSPKGMDGMLGQWGFPFASAAIFVGLAGFSRLSIREIFLFSAAGLVFALFLLFSGQEKYTFAGILYMLATPLGVVWGMQALLIRWRLKNDEDLPQWISAFWWILIATLALGVASNTMLRVGIAIYPLTYDLHLAKIDAAFGSLAEEAARYFIAGPEWFRSLTSFIYGILPLLFFPMVAWAIREKKIRTMHGWRAMVVPVMIAWLCYSWLPATGPIYAFGADVYPMNMPELGELPAKLTPAPMASRNAVPSMHFSGAIWVMLMAAAFRRKVFFALSVFFVSGTAWATLALGEHYVVDLIVAAPFAASVGLWLMNPPRWKQAPLWAKYLQWTAASLFLLWMVLLRLFPVWLQDHIGFTRILSVWSVTATFVLLSLHIRAVWREEDTNEEMLRQSAPKLVPADWKAPALLPEELRGNYWLIGIFFFSGLAGLVYEVVYAKALGVTFGGTSLAAKTVLMTYMGGMAFGAWLGGMLAERTSRPLLWYAYFEALIGIYAAVTPLLFEAIQALYVSLATDLPPDASSLTVVRMALGATVLGVPTVLMGATLPLVFQCLRGMGIPTGRAIAPLYGANVLGAAVGALVAGYALLPAVGRNGGTLLASLISLMVSLYVLDKIKRGVIPRLTYPTPLGQNIVQPAPSAVAPALGVVALTTLLIGGAVTLALEVVFMHLLAVVAGNSVYAFGLMLATFLLGLGLGSTVGERVMQYVERQRMIVWAQCGIALSILATSFVWDGLAEYMGSFGYAVQHGLHLDFAGRELVRAIVCALAMLPPAFFIGISYPAAMGLAADWLGQDGRVARGVGIASGINTLGNIAGVLLAGFWWLPAFGSRDVLLGLAVTAVLLAGIVAWFGDKSDHQFSTRWVPLIVMALTLILFPLHWNYTALSQGGNVYFYPQQWGEVIDHSESIEGGLTTVARNSDGLLTLLTNGKFQGNNAEGGEMVAQESFALIPLLHTAHRDKALVIGYGTGMTARVLQDQGFAQQDVVELSSDIVVMADKHFSNINEKISSHPAVHMHYTDGRNYLLTQTKQFDLISLEITSIWFAGAANLYNREFYELANKRLLVNGVLQQWVQLHHMRPIDFLYILGSVRSVFKNVWIYASGGQGIIVASNGDEAVNNNYAAEKLLRSHTISDINLENLHSTLVAAPEKVDALMARYDPSMNFFVSTDANLYLEYATPKGNAVTTDTRSVLIDMLKAGGQ